MKNYNPKRFASSLKESSNKLLVSVALMFSVLSCSDVHLEDLSPESLASEQRSLATSKDQKDLAALRASSGTSITEIQFTATALIAHCYGENITFMGTIENRVTSTTDAEGVTHYTRSFNTKGMTGVGVTSGTEYDVIGGAEMFAIQDAVITNGALNLPASLLESDIVIHQGTLVFESRDDGSRVIARHIIHKVPGQEGVINRWECRGTF